MVQKTTRLLSGMWQLCNVLCLGHFKNIFDKKVFDVKFAVFACRFLTQEVGGSVTLFARFCFDGNTLFDIKVTVFHVKKSVSIKTKPCKKTLIETFALLR